MTLPKLWSLFLTVILALFLFEDAFAQVPSGYQVENYQGASNGAVWTNQPILGAAGSATGEVQLYSASNNYLSTILPNTGLSAAAAYQLPVVSGTDTLLTAGSTTTLTNKTLTSPTITSPTITGTTSIGSGATITSPTLVTPTLGVATATSINGNVLTTGTGTLTLQGSSQTYTSPAATDTLVGRASTDTLTNKTLTSPTITTPILDNPPTPGGRLSLSSTVPVPTSDQSAKSTIYYLPYVNNFVPIYNGTNWQESAIGSSGINFTLGATNMPTTQVYDVYAVNVSGTTTLCSMYWGGNTSRSLSAGGKTGASDATITQLNGIWVNHAALSASDCFGGASGTTGVAAGINQATLLGTYYTSGSASTQVVCNPSAASGGAAVGVYLSNAYNRVPLTCSNQDSATSVTSTSASWAVLGASDTAQWVDALQQVSVSYDAHVVAGNGTAGDLAAFGVACAGSGTTAPSIIAAGGAATATLADNYNTLAVHQGLYPSLGLSPVCYAEKQDPSAGGTATYMPTAHYENFSMNLAY